MVNKKYVEIYKKSNTRKEYLEGCKKQKLNYSSSLRRYYDLVEMETGGSIKQFKEPVSIEKNSIEINKKKDLSKFHNGLRISVIQMKIEKVKDMRRLGFETNRSFLKKHGFNDMEINTLDDMGLVDE